MKNNSVVITILPHKRQIRAAKGTTLLEALIHYSIFLRTDCGGKGTCGKCRVEVVLPDQSVKSVRSCKFELETDVSIRIPETSMLSSHIMSKAQIFFPDGYPRKASAESADSFGVAVDLGTTTIAVYLCNMAKGTVLSSLAVKNPQALYGDDVMSRIGVIGQDGGNLKKLQAMVVKSIEWGISELASKDSPVEINRVVVVGNPAMIHILAGVDPQPIGVSPYLPVFHEARAYDAKDLGFISVTCRVNFLPQVSGFIGGDILAAALAVDIKKLSPGSLLVDLGTNGELIFKGKDKLYATSCATGPAFEGASLACGMQAIPGAINRVSIKRVGVDKTRNGENTVTVEVSSIQDEGGPDVPAAGICGAGLLNAVARMCDHGIVEPDGRFAGGEKEFVLVGEDPATDRPSVYISQKDIRSVQLGKSALITGIEFLCEKAGFDMPKTILIAGAFGSHQDKKDLVRLGLLPDIGDEKIITMGNAAGSGAVMALCDDSYLDDAKAMAGNVEVVNLAVNMEFQERFIENLNFPEPVVR